MELTIERRYRGPLASANGGYACGLLAAYVQADEVEVTLRLPPPLGRPLVVERGGALVRLLDGDALVAEARPARVDVDQPPPVSLEEADSARNRHVRGGGSDFGECFVCGTRADGLRVHVGPVAGREPLHAAPVVLDARHSRLDASPRAEASVDSSDTVSLGGDRPASELVWAAIDCPGAYAVGAEGRGDVVLGRMTARVDRVPRPGERCAVVSWPLGEEGRKLHAGTALFAGDGALLALAKQVWIAPR
jgi:hypothetical protein